jgi:hypothetical protein
MRPGEGTLETRAEKVSKSFRESAELFHHIEWEYALQASIRSDDQNIPWRRKHAPRPPNRESLERGVKRLRCRRPLTWGPVQPKFAVLVSEEPNGSVGNSLF